MTREEAYCSHLDEDGAPCGYACPCPYHADEYADTREWDGDGNVLSGSYHGKAQDPYSTTTE